MGETQDRSFSADFKRSVYRGLAVLLPSVLTLWIIVYAYRFVDSTIAEPINAGLREGLTRAADYFETLGKKFDPSPEAVQQALATQPSTLPTLSEYDVTYRLRRTNIEQWWAGNWMMDLIGLVVAIMAVYVAGRLLGGFVGRSIWKYFEKVIISVPIFKQIYPSVKQMVDFIFSDEKPIKFNRVVMVQFPSRGTWSLGFVTGGALRSVAESAGADVTVFVPCSPAPFSGFTVTVSAADLIEVPLSVDEAVRYLVSGGVLVPGHQSLDSVLADHSAKMQAGASTAPGARPVARH